MAISSLVPVTEEADAKTFNITGAYLTSKAVANFPAGGYTITTSPTTAQVEVQFYNNSTASTSFTTVSGTIGATLSFDATSVIAKDVSNFAGPTIVTITLTSEVLTPSNISGTLDTVTTTGTYNTTGALYLLVVGGGAGGGGGRTASGDRGAGGGGSGFISNGLVYTNNSTSVTIGNGGNGGNTGAGSGGAGGTTSFGSLLSANGGNGGIGGTGAGSVLAGNGAGNGGDGAKSGDQRNNANASSAIYLSVTNGTTGGGGGGGGNRDTTSNGNSGAGSGIGTGGNGANINATPNAGTGYGAGGGGGRSGGNDFTTAGAAGSAGVVYVLRGF